MKEISKTCYYCCGVRMQDAESAHPVIGDYYAKRLLGEEGIQYWNEFKKFHKPNASNIARHYIIDNHLRQSLNNNPDSTSFLIGAGLDSRAYRFKGGHWVEMDEPAVIQYKNSVLPVSECENRLERIAIDFEKEIIADKLSSYKEHRNVVIVIEGVFMYLDDHQKKLLLTTLTTLFPTHTLYCDLMKKKFFYRFSKPIHKEFLKQGTAFCDLTNEPNKLLLLNGYKQISSISTVKTANDLGLMNMPKILIKIFRKMMMGYSVYNFAFRPDR